MRRAELDSLMEHVFLQLTSEPHVKYIFPLGSNGKGAYWSRQNGGLYDECLLVRGWSNYQRDNKKYDVEPKGTVSSLRFTTTKSDKFGSPTLSTKIDSTDNDRNVKGLLRKVPEELETLRKYIERRGSWLRRYVNVLSQDSVRESEAQIVYDDRLIGVSVDSSMAKIRRNFGEWRSYEETRLLLEFRPKKLSLTLPLINEQHATFSNVKV